MVEAKVKLCKHALATTLETPSFFSPRTIIELPQTAAGIHHRHYDDYQRASKQDKVGYCAMENVNEEASIHACRTYNYGFSLAR